MGVEQITVVDTVWYDWVLFLLAAIVGSMASSLTNNNGKALMCGWEVGDSNENDGSPRKYCMGIIADIIIGIAAAVAILWTLTPQTSFQLIGIAAVAGYGGSSVLRALVNKLDAQSSQEKAKELKEEAEENKENAETNDLLKEFEAASDIGKKDNIKAIKDYLLENNKQVLKDLYDNKIINESK